MRISPNLLSKGFSSPSSKAARPVVNFLRMRLLVSSPSWTSMPSMIDGKTSQNRGATKVATPVFYLQFTKLYDILYISYFYERMVHLMAYTILNESPSPTELNPDIVVNYDKKENRFVVISTETEGFYRVPCEELHSSELRFAYNILEEILPHSGKHHFDVLLAPSAQTRIFLIRERNCR